MRQLVMLADVVLLSLLKKHGVDVRGVLINTRVVLSRLSQVAVHISLKVQVAYVTSLGDEVYCQSAYVLHKQGLRYSNIVTRLCEENLHTP